MPAPLSGAAPPRADVALAAPDARPHRRGITATAERLDGFERRPRSLERASSFLAVGGVLLLGGFFYERLSVDSTA
jgi:hypothetical protein